MREIEHRAADLAGHKKFYKQVVEERNKKQGGDIMFYYIMQIRDDVKYISLAIYYC